MKRNLKKLALVLVALMLAVSFAACNNDPPAPVTPDPVENENGEEEVAAPAYPTRDITIVVPWGAGGGTDLTVRSLADQMQIVLGENMPVLNMGGAGGSIGMQDVFDAARDGYRILGTSMSSLATVRIMGLADIAYTDWYAWNAAFTPNVIVVRGDSPYETLQDLIDAMAAAPGTITLGSAGPGSSGHVGAVLFAESAGVTFNHIPYEGGGAAIIATLGGEVEFSTQLLSEKIDHIRSGDLRALATLSDQPMEIVGADGETIVIPSAGSIVPALAPALPFGGSFGIMVPRDTPSHIVETLESAYLVAVASPEFNAFTEDRGMIAVGMSIAQTDAYLATTASRVGWILWDAGLAVESPETFGIPRL